ncbi:MAG: hypothetical protein NT069_11855 [Planctomycetota bacterium]|nr:hypothetical protein [Planctomycetota bacterium]
MKPNSRRRAAATSTSEAGTRRLITIDDLTRIIWVSDPQIAPDGKSIVFVRKHVGEKNNYVTNIWSVSTDGGEPRQFTSGGKDRRPRFSPDGSRLALISEREKGGAQIWGVHLVSRWPVDRRQFSRTGVGLD